MPISIAIVDDLRTDCAYLASEVHRWFDEHPGHDLRLYFYESAEAMLSERPPVQLAFLDICMDGMTGVELAHALRRLDEKILLVFLSTSRDFAFEAFPVHPFDYLLKPCDPAALDRVLSEALRVLATPDPSVLIRIPRGERSVPLRSIVSAVSQGHSVELTLVDAPPLRSNLTFAELEALLSPDPRFLLCNRGVLVNMDYVRSLDDDTLRMQDGVVFPLRTRGRADLVRCFSQYQISRLKGGRA